MSVTIIMPTNNPEFIWKTPIIFKVRIEDKVVRLEF